MFGLGIPELVVILVIALLVLGPGKLPEVGKFLGKSLRDFRDALEHRHDDEAADQGAAPPARPEASPPDKGTS